MSGRDAGKTYPYRHCPAFGSVKGRLQLGSEGRQDLTEVAALCGADLDQRPAQHVKRPMVHFHDLTVPHRDYRRSLGPGFPDGAPLDVAGEDDVRTLVVYDLAGMDMPQRPVLVPVVDQLLDPTGSIIAMGWATGQRGMQ
jgi:hypothetical protein